MDLVFRCRTSLHIPRDGKLSLGRTKPILSWDNVLISRNHVQLHFQQNGTVLELSVTGRNAVVVERQGQKGGSWDVVTVIDPGGSALLPIGSLTDNHATRFFVLGAREQSAVELRTAPGQRPPQGPMQVDDPPPAKRPRLAGVPAVVDDEEATAALAAAPGEAVASAAVTQSSAARQRNASAAGKAGGAGALSESPPPSRQIQQSLPSPSSAAVVVAGTPLSTETNRSPAERHQHAAPYDIESPIHLLRVRGLAPRFNVGCLGVHLRRLVSGPLQLALVSNYMVDMGWLLSCCPDLAMARQLFVVHGEPPESEPEMRQQAAAAGASHAVLHRPPLPILYGTHHSKAFLLTYPAGLRLIIHTANCVAPDCNDKTQAVWLQDFPRKGAGGGATAASTVAESGAAAASPFERDLAAYFRALALPAAMAGPVLEAIAAHDFSYARAVLIASVPGYHRGVAAVQSYGHMRLRRLLAQVPLPAGFRGAAGEAAAAGGSAEGPEGLVIQCSSMGSFDQAWLVDELGASLAAHRESSPSPALPQRQQPDGDMLAAAAGPRPSGPLGCGPLPLAVVWPTTEEVRNSVEGWNAGRSIPGPARNVNKPFMGRYYAAWGGEAAGRQRAMPHIKTYTRYRGQQLAWFLVTSHNLSKAAWGELQKNGTQLMIRSYELGVLVTPALEAAYRSSPQFGFCCDGGGPSPAAAEQLPHHSSWQGQLQHQRHTREAAPAAVPVASPPRLTFWTLTGGNGRRPDDGVVCCSIPVPYAIPPTPYRGGVDIPWTVDTPQAGLDALGLTWGSHYSHYGYTQQD